MRGRPRRFPAGDRHQEEIGGVQGEGYQITETELLREQQRLAEDRGVVEQLLLQLQGFLAEGESHEFRKLGRRQERRQRGSRRNLLRLKKRWGAERSA